MTTLAPSTQRPHVKVRRARRAAQLQNQQQTEAILAEGATQAQLAAEAATLTQASLTPAETQRWIQDMEARLLTIQQHPEQNLGDIEEQLARSVRDPLRLLAERAAQVKINATPTQCLSCHRPLLNQKLLPRTVNSRFGNLRLWRPYGFCCACDSWQFPADHALGLAKSAPASPYLQEICALLVSKMPPEQAVAVAERLGLDLSRCTLDREAHRQGLKAQALRAQSLAQLDTWEGLQALAKRVTDGPPSQPFTLVIEIDAWNIRERDDWGQTKTLRAQGQQPSRWHWVYLATVFRLDHRAQTAGQRAVITQRGYVATRLGLEALVAQLHHEALRRGLGQASRVLVIADGALWIWNLVKDRFPEACQQLDLYHADEHLWAVAHELYGRGTPEARAWVAPLLQQVRDDQTTAVISTLTELKPRLLEAEQKKLQTQIDYFANNAHRMRYRAIIAAREAVEQRTATPEQTLLANQPLGSGAVESACRQYQCRFKRTGQFWSLDGDEALLCLETLWRNGRWQDLFPHAKSSVALN